MLLFQVTAASRALRHDDTAPASVPSTAINAQVLTDAARNTPNIDHVWPTCATSSIVDIPVLCERRFDNMQLPETPAGWLAGDVGLGGRDEQDEGGRALIVVDKPRPFAHYCSYFLCLSRGVMTLTNNKIRKLSNGRHPEERDPETMDHAKSRSKLRCGPRIPRYSNPNLEAEAVKCTWSGNGRGSWLFSYNVTKVAGRWLENSAGGPRRDTITLWET